MPTGSGMTLIKLKRCQGSVRVAMNIATPSASATVPIGDAGVQPAAGRETKGIFVPRAGPIRQICCRHSTRLRNTTSHPAPSADRAYAKPVDPLIVPEVQGNPRLMSFLGWLKQAHSASIYQFFGQQLATNPETFARIVDKQPNPGNCEAIFEALCRQVWQ